MEGLTPSLTPSPPFLAQGNDPYTYGSDEIDTPEVRYAHMDRWIVKGVYPIHLI